MAMQKCLYCIKEANYIKAEAATRGGVFEHFAKVTKKTCARVSTLLKKVTLAQVFSCDFAKFLRTPFSLNNSGRLLLKGLSKVCIHNSH